MEKSFGRRLILPNILVVDDSKVARLMIKNILEQQGFKVFEAEDLSSVENEIFSKELSLKDIDLIFLDINLKDGSGFELLSFLREKYPNIPVIMMSVENKRETIIKAIKSGAKDYILKPFTKKILLDKIAAHLPAERLKERYKIDTTSLINNISCETNRSIRSRSPFTLLKLKYDALEINMPLDDLKKILIDNVREIDQVYSIKNNEFVLLLPLTDKNGAKILANRLKKKICAFCQNIREEIVTFPQDIEEMEKLNFRNQKKYIQKILQKLGISQDKDID